jgi:hypothetical protein
MMTEKSKADKAFERILEDGYIETDRYNLTDSQLMTVFNKGGKYRIMIEHQQGYQVFDEVGSHLTGF